MQLTTLFNDDSAVSPVIGVILMVAITVILAAVIGTFVLGLGDQVSETSPQASFDFDYNSTSGNLTITHESGTSIDADSVTISGPVDDNGDTWADIDGSATEISAGSSITVTSNTTPFASGETVRVVWTSESGSSSSTLQSWTYNG
ncbi:MULTISPECIES: type IV pilin [Haloferax]|uniref:type IV pilin n=1 Tax=Haloferax TaxID=2251 RepID=UPI000E24D501|nr:MULTISPECIES: type IV pilin N-terminal domain-containing protein [Haloferax]RDZ35262.1 type IV pilin [Haloferax sp. Atlit-24N]RLM35673.1 type IV pilin [Haloferax sp. Atlit-109R]RLM43521.1 type IV pilin [Haloferax sp. Atlit-105R]WEL26790.1 Pilin/Flagellin, FlaG/FlaF family [Haloferax lucentense]